MFNAGEKFVVAVDNAHLDIKDAEKIKSKETKEIKVRFEGLDEDQNGRVTISLPKGGGHDQIKSVYYVKGIPE